MYKKLRPQVFLRDGLMVEDGQATNTRKNEVFSDFVGQRFHRDEQDICRSQSIPLLLAILLDKKARPVFLLLLRLHTPKTNLTIVQRDLICTTC